MNTYVAIAVHGYDYENETHLVIYAGSSVAKATKATKLHKFTDLHADRLYVYMETWTSGNKVKSDLVRSDKNE